MDYVRPAIMLAVMLPFAAFLLNAFWAFDRLVRFEFERFPEEWQRDGKPGVFYGRLAPGMPRTWRSGFAAQRCIFKWLFVTPAWVRQNAESREALRKYRLLTLVWNFVAVPLWGLTMLLIVYLNP